METIDQYQLRERLGSGAFATVWLAYDPGLDGLVAVKILGDNWVGQPDIVRRFVDEARLLWRAEDPRVVDVYRVGTRPSGQPWFAMEYADRGTLDERLAEAMPALDDAIGLIAEMGECVSAVHKLGAVHRDVKPANFLIRSLSQGVDRAVPALMADERLMIGDLGLAKVLANSSGFTVAAGSPTYMAPEQASISADVSFAADVYSLGVCAWEVLTGAPPPSTEGSGLGMRLDLDALPALHDIRPDAPAEVDAAIRTALQPDPEQRWASVDDFVAALRNATKPPAVVALTQRASTLSEPATAAQPIRRRAVLAALAVALLVAAAVAGWLLLGSDDSAGPSWFDLPAGATDVSVSESGGSASVVARVDDSFVGVCKEFITTALDNGYDLVRDECADDTEIAALQSDSGTSAVIALLSDGRIGWQFEADE